MIRETQTELMFLKDIFQGSKEKEEDKFFYSSFKCSLTVRAKQATTICPKKKENQRNIENKENIDAA
jgi:hypothetical protein